MIHVVDHKKPMTGKGTINGQWIKIKWHNGVQDDWKRIKHLSKSIKLYDNGKPVEL